MIQLPQRSVTRFFIPLIDVLTLLFCIYLLMPIVKPASDEDLEGDGRVGLLGLDERQQLEQLRKEKKAWLGVERLRKEESELRENLEKIRKDRLDVLQHRLAIRVLEIGAEGKLYYYNPRRGNDRHVAITAENVRALIRSQREAAGDQELYFLILYPRVASGSPAFPLRSQREEYDRWFEGVAHGYDIPISTR